MLCYVYSHKRTIVHKIGSINTLQRRLSDYFGDKDQHCTGIPMTAEYIHIKSKYLNTTIDHINNKYYSGDCKIIRDETGKSRCTKCQTLLRNYKRARSNELNSAKPKTKTPFSKYTAQQLLMEIREQNQILKATNKQLKRYEMLFHKHQTLITILENDIKYEYQDFNNFIRFINKNYDELSEYFEKHPNSLSFLNDQFRLMLLRKSNKIQGMRWSHPSILIGMYIRTHPSTYKLLTESNVIYLPSIRTLDKHRQEWVTDDGMNEKLTLLLESEYKTYAKNRNIKHPPYFAIQVDEMYVQEVLWYNPSNMTVRGQISKIHEEACLQSLINLLTKNDDLKPSHVMLQVNFVDLRSGFYFEGPSYGSAKGWKGIELYKILIGDVFKKLWEYIPTWKINICFFDCASINASFISGCMDLTESKLCEKEILQFIDPFTGTKVHAIWCGDHVAKNTRNKIATGTLKYGKDPILWKFLEDLVDLSVMDVNNSNFATAKKLDERAVKLSSSFDKMRVSYYLNVTSDATLALLYDMIRTNEKFKQAQPLYEILKHLSGIFNGIVIGPKIKLKNQKNL